jgi:hypothetical protein
MDEHCKKPALVFYQFLKKMASTPRIILVLKLLGMFKEHFSTTSTSIHRLKPVIPLLITPNVISS